MLLTAVALLSRFNASRVSADEDYTITTDYQKCGTSFFTDNIDYWKDLSQVGTCYYLDYSPSITLTVDNYEYTNPIFFCPSGASKIKFNPDNEIYCAEFSLSTVVLEQGSCEIFKSIYVTTESTSIKTPVYTSECEDAYFDLVLTPVPSGTIKIKGNATKLYDYEDGIISILFDEEGEETSTVTVTVSSGASYTIKNPMNQRYSISIPELGPYVFNGENGVVAKSSKSGLSVGAMSGIAVVAVVVVGAAVGVSVYFIIRKRNKGKGDESSSSSS